MSEYLKNPICKLKPIGFTPDMSNKTNMITAVFFKRGEYYKNFHIYVKGLKGLIRFIDKKTRNYKFRIFIDQNVLDDKEIMNILKSSKKVQPVLFECANYMEGKYHIDLFGTMVRFFPFFDFENNDSLDVINMDIDVGLEALQAMKYLTIIKEREFMGPSRLTELIGNDSLPYIIAYPMKAIQKYDKNIVLNFIEDAPNYKSVGKYGIRKTPFGFGVDEIFTNEIMFPQFERFVTHKHYTISYFLYYLLYTRTKKKVLDEKLQQTTQLIMKEILGKYHQKEMSIDDMFKAIDGETYGISKHKSEKAHYFTYRFSKVVQFIIQNNLKWIDIEVLKFIDKYLLNVVQAFVLTTVTTKGKIIKMKLFDKIMVDRKIINNNDNDNGTELSSELSEHLSE